jgi:hypothetical protein
MVGSKVPRNDTYFYFFVAAGTYLLKSCFHCFASSKAITVQTPFSLFYHNNLTVSTNLLSKYGLFKTFGFFEKGQVQNLTREMMTLQFYNGASLTNGSRICKQIKDAFMQISNNIGTIFTSIIMSNMV